MTKGMINKLISTWSIDAIHFHNWPDYSLSILNSFDIPVVYDCHDHPEIERGNFENITFVYVSKAMREKFAKPEQRAIVIPPLMLNEPTNTPKKNGKIMYLSSFYRRGIIEPICRVLDVVSNKYVRDLDIYCSTPAFHDEIKRCISGMPKVHFKGSLSIDSFENTEYEFGLVETETDIQASYSYPSKVADYISFGLEIIHHGREDSYVGSNLEKINSTSPSLGNYYWPLFKAYNGIY